MAGEQTANRRGSGGFKSSAGHVFGTLQQVFDDVWWAWGTTRVGPGILFPRSMAIVREQGALVVIHPVLMPAAEQKKIEALGPIGHVVRLGAFHGMDDPAYVERYAPTTWAPPGVDLAPGVKIDRELRPGVDLPLAGASCSRSTARAPPKQPSTCPGTAGSCSPAMRSRTGRRPAAAHSWAA